MKDFKYSMVNFQRILLLYLCLYIPTTLAAQDRWIEGKVILSEDSTFSGFFQFGRHVDKEIIALKQGDKLLALPPKEVIAAEGVTKGERKMWKAEKFTHKKTTFSVHLFLEELYNGQQLNLYKKDLSYIKWSPYANILIESIEFDSYKHLENTDVLLLQEYGTGKMLVINRPNAWAPNKYVINKSILCEYLETDKQTLKKIIKQNDLKLDDLQDIINLVMILDDKRAPSPQLSLSQ